MAGPVVTPEAIGTVANLVGVHMRGKVTLPPGARSVSSFEVEVASRATPDVALFHRDGGPIQPVVGPRRIRFMSLNGCPAHPGMTVDLRRPPVHVRISEPIKAFSWRLMQNGHAVEEKADTVAGLSEDGRCITIVPRRPLIRNGRLPVGYFFPPFAVLDKAPRSYFGRTYGPNDEPSNPPGHHAFAVDFNRGSGAEEEGDPVLAAQAGTVTFVDRAGKGTVQICHRGVYMTQYTHMTDIPERFGNGSFSCADGADQGAEVDLQEQVGRIGKVGTGSPHLHHQHHHGKIDGKWVPVQIRFGGRRYDASRAHPVNPPADLDSWRSPSPVFVSRVGVKGWTADRTAAYHVTVRFPDNQLISKHLRFSLVAAHSLPDCVDPGCGANSPLTLDDVYDGPVLPAGDYSVRYRCTDDLGVTGPWAADPSVVIAPAVP